MNLISLFASSVVTSSVLVGFLLVTGLVVVLLALGGIVVACYIAVPPVHRAIDRRMYSPRQLLKEASDYQLIEFMPPPVPRHPLPRRGWEMGRQMRMGGLGLLILTQQTQVVMDPGTASILVVILALLVLAFACGAFDDQPQKPHQPSFDDYLEDLRRESADYLDKVDRLYRNR